MSLEDDCEDTYHNKEAHANGLADFDKFTLVGYHESQRVMSSHDDLSTYAWCSGERIGNPPGQSPWGYRQVPAKSRT
jgi:hypothetical protein